ncbi:MAG TPA: hypothetical protein VHO69_12530, partial [Phototrophicaceae bacterium]|nr:hypothetical protein [Phototrophicaceae bacterium]
LEIIGSVDYLAQEKPTEEAILPVTMNTTTEEHFQQLIFVYLYFLPQRRIPAEHWQWVPYQQAKLLPDVIQAIQNRQTNLNTEYS